jgi:predicted nucleotide-binding protein
MDLLPAVLNEDNLRFDFLFRRKRVFIIHGHDQVNLDKLQTMLYKLNLEPVIMKDNHVFASYTIIEKFEKLGSKCKFAIAICTPDDNVSNSTISNAYYQPRPNVIYEIGWFSAKIGRRRVVLLVKNGTSIFSDFQGVVQIGFNDSVRECFEQVYQVFKGKA